MNDTFLVWLSTIQLEVLVPVSVVLISVSVVCIKNASKFKEFYDKRVKDNIKKEHEYNELTKNVGDATIALDKVLKRLDEMEGHSDVRYGLIQDLTDSVNVLKDNQEKNKQQTNSIEKKLNDIGNKSSAQYNMIENVRRDIESIKEDQSRDADRLNLLIESDKDDIKAYIVSEYHKWIGLGYIDLYSLQSIEERYDKYLKENGNTFVGTLMVGIRKLPHGYCNEDQNK